MRCTLPLESIDFGVRELMRLGDEVRVSGPPALRASVCASAARMARRIASDQPRTLRERAVGLALPRAGEGETLSERERERLDAGIEKLDLERAIGDVALDAQQLIQAAVSSPRRLPSADASTP